MKTFSNCYNRFHLFVFLLLVTIPNAVMACPSCQGILQNGKLDPYAAGFNYSIMMMMPIPFIIVIVYGLVFYRLSKKPKTPQLSGEHSNSIQERNHEPVA